MILRFVTDSCPFSPLFPLVSSTALMLSISTSPRRGFSNAKGTSKRISRSCQIVFASSALEEELDIVRAPQQRRERNSQIQNGRRSAEGKRNSQSRKAQTRGGARWSEDNSHRQVVTGVRVSREVGRCVALRADPNRHLMSGTAPDPERTVAARACSFVAGESGHECTVVESGTHRATRVDNATHDTCPLAATLFQRSPSLPAL